MPALGAGAFVWAANVLMGLATASFGWAFRWFGSVVAPRAYQYPAADAEVQAFAAGLTAFHAAAGLDGDALDAAVLIDLRTFMMEQFSAAARKNRSNNEAKLTARSQAMLFTLGGFALAFACGVLIFLHNVIRPSLPSGTAAHATADQSAARHAGQANGRASLASAAALPGRGRETVEDERGSALMERNKRVKEVPKAPPPAAKPPPPPPTIVRKVDDSPPARK